jgi:hypothetical protein
MWSRKRAEIEKHIDAMKEQSSRDNLLAAIAGQVESGQLSPEEIRFVLNRCIQKGPTRAASPLIVCFGMNMEHASAVALRGESKSFADFADKSERVLINRIVLKSERPVIQAEPSLRTGETISIRLAIWDYAAERLPDLLADPWEILEVAPFEEIYPRQRADELFARAAKNSFTLFDAERDGCPICGGPIRISSSASESGEFAIASCEKCGIEQYGP